MFTRQTMDMVPRLRFVDSNVSVYTALCTCYPLAKLVQDEDKPGELFFQFSNMDRRRILEEALKGSIKLNETARKLEMTPTETFRQLQRLTEAALLEKLPGDRYGATAYARLVFGSSAHLRFISQHREFFLTHDASRLPAEFRLRLGDLSKGILFTDNITSLNKLTELLRNAKERIDIMAEERFGVHSEIMDQRQQEGVKLRGLLQESLIPTVRTLPRSNHPPPEMRVIPRVCAAMMMTEKEAGVTLPRTDGKFDQIGFYGTDESFLRWTGDLFRDQWERAKPWHP